MIIDTFDLMIIIIFLCNDVITIMVIILATISFTQTRQISKYEVFVSDKPLHGWNVFQVLAAGQRQGQADVAPKAGVDIGQNQHWLLIIDYEQNQHWIVIKSVQRQDQSDLAPIAWWGRINIIDNLFGGPS